MIRIESGSLPLEDRQNKGFGTDFEMRRGSGLLLYQKDVFCVLVFSFWPKKLVEMNPGGRYKEV